MAADVKITRRRGEVERRVGRVRALVLDVGEPVPAREQDLPPARHQDRAAEVPGGEVGLEVGVHEGRAPWSSTSSCCSARLWPRSWGGRSARSRGSERRRKNDEDEEVRREDGVGLARVPARCGAGCALGFAGVTCIACLCTVGRVVAGDGRGRAPQGSCEDGLPSRRRASRMSVRSTSNFAETVPDGAETREPVDSNRRVAPHARVPPAGPGRHDARPAPQAGAAPRCAWRRSRGGCTSATSCSSASGPGSSSRTTR